MISEKDWLRALCEIGVRPFTAAKWAAAFEDQFQPERFSKGMLDIVDALPQLLHETAMLEQMQENLSYSAERLMAVWPSRFPTLSDAAPYARNPEALANKVYGGRMGNTEPGDGWLYRGRAWGLTGKSNYALVGDLMGQDLLTLPHLIEGPIYALESFRAFWEGMIPDTLLGDQVKLRRRYNGGEIGLAHCQKLANLTRQVLA